MTADFSAPPPMEMLSWVKGATGDRVVGVHQLPGATTAAVHRIDLAAGVSVVLKRFVWGDFVAEEPERARHEAEMLLKVSSTDVPAPQLIAFDEVGLETDAPAVLTSFIPGSVAVDVAPEALAEVAAQINSVDPGDIEWRYEPYFGNNDVFPPAWASSPAVWDRLIEIAQAVDTDGSHFVHRDFHPWNVLAENDRVTGVIDWLSAARGPWEIDVGHCRANLVLLDRYDAAERYRIRYEQLTGLTYSPVWDAMTIVDAMPYYSSRAAVDAWPGHDVIEPFIRDASQRTLLDTFAARTAAALR